MADEKKKKNILLYNLLFVAVCAGIFLFLWNAPPETTAHLPHDQHHQQLLTIDKKESEKHCG
jgi:flagellar basal body-associated protein FliL